MNQTTSSYATELRAQAQRRRDAANRLPPLDCGCRDPETWEHRNNQCRWRPRRRQRAA